MATSHARFTATLQDQSRVKAAVPAYLTIDTSQTVAEAVTALQAWAALLDACTSSLITDIHISIDPTFVSAIDKGALASDNAQTAVLDMEVEGTGRLWGFPIPARIQAAVVSGNLDKTNGAIAAMYGELTAGPAGYVFTDPLWVPLGAFSRGFLTSRKRRKLRENSSSS
jgi:hypothetical protein